MLEFIKNLNPVIVLGIFLIIINYPIGWLGIGMVSHCAMKKGKDKKYYIIGTALYALSWVLFLLGIVLCGKELADDFSHKYRVLIIAITVVGTLVSVLYIRHKKKQKSMKNQ